MVTKAVEQDTTKMTAEEKQAYVVMRLREMGIRVEPGNKKPSEDDEYSAIITNNVTIIFKSDSKGCPKGHAGL